MPSQLWQRLKAARKFADLTQSQVAVACGVTRSAYAFWESSEEAIRTRPSAEQVMAVAKLAHVPIEWLMNDAASVDDVWRLGSLSSAPSRVNGHAFRQEQDQTDRATETFWRAVEYHVISTEPQKQDAFSYEIMPPPFKLVADFYFRKHLVEFCARGSKDCVYDDLGRILTLERALHRPLAKTILVWSQGVATDVDQISETLDATFAVKIVVVDNVQDAAAFLLSLN